MACFKDTDICARIQGINEWGHCDISERHRAKTWTMDLDRLDRASDYGNGMVPDFEEIADLYVPVANDHPRGQQLSERLRSEWGIFSLTHDEINTFLSVVLQDYFTENPEVQYGLVMPAIQSGTKFFRAASILSGKSWSEFEDVIQYRNRFHNGLFQPDKLIYFFEQMISDISAGERYFRARIIQENEMPLTPDKIGSAPPEKAAAGRLNATGISYLYLGSDQTTVVLEIKAAIQDLVAIGEFEVVTPLRVIDLDMLANLGPFRISDKSSYLINRPILLAIDDALRRQSTRQRGEVAYVPTEYISDLIKTMTDENGESVDGIFYDSTVNPGYKDLVLFNENKVKLKGSIKYSKISKLIPELKPYAATE
ncbi:RES family NAD+ phosphorylase [Schleiferilactobacillus harbinensis]|jgi:hypothetical protein|uniref:RES family NAD+ phosphorylase n=2 Tax=Schleiferilactobacillus harbinensis TaxID=304207 RepID=UPI00242D082F|nr:RES family NAD+ phosphorylase [Schleiferilactobacillus harbinensis]MCI1688001.1 RES family NAD+ phosphorylase [Schleiferilactobacillus harbinensis]MCI1783141.1 RES family NAD+ phosphorylase [Schleiferilactobacillus harbinensis]MCI1850963.1 RES family NAD+ phosphorylase [Schleiferilactobacillus harbinensis]